MTPVFVTPNGTAGLRFEWPLAVDAISSHGDYPQALTSLRKLCQECVDNYDGPQQPFRLRVVLSQDGKIEAQAFPTLALSHDLLHASTFDPTASAPSAFPTRLLTVHIDSQPTPQSLYTSYKTTARAHYDAARARVRIPSSTAPEEVLLYNSEGSITEGSVRNVAFWRHGRWVTPGLDTGCLSGTVRRWLLEQGRVVEGNIKREEVSVGECMLLFNGVEGCALGVVSSQ